MLIMKLNCNELLQQRQRGRRLVEALLAQLHKVRLERVRTTLDRTLTVCE